MADGIDGVTQKSYLHNNFTTVVAIITALQTVPVSLAMYKIWARVGMWEVRVFDDLKEFASPRENFKFVREATTALTDKRPVTAPDPTGPKNVVPAGVNPTVKGKATEGKGIGATVGCVPFFGK